MKHRAAWIGLCGVVFGMGMGVGVGAAAGAPATGPGEPAAIPAGQRLYVVVVSEATYADAAWRAVVDALAAKHKARVVRYAGAVEGARGELAAWMPDYICFVARPEEANRNFVLAVSRMTRRLDDDPYTDAVWGILTGYDASDALRIAKRTEPLIVKRGASGAGAGHVWGLESCFATAETCSDRFWEKKAGEKGGDRQVKPDVAESLANGFNTMRPQVFYTSGHASERDWQIGYNVRAGQFRHRNGKLFAVNTEGKAFPIVSPEPKVYLPMGNCLIGDIDRADCMATAWMHTGGVYQMYGYTAVTWVGLMGWGVAGAFNAGTPLTEAFYFCNQGLVRDLRRKYPQYAAIELDDYSENGIGQQAVKHRLVKRDEKTGQWSIDEGPLGMLWDRDCVAFYGDPAWEARLPVERAWKQAWSRQGKVWTLTITPEKDKAGPGGLSVFLPERLTGAKMLAGEEPNTILTDNFLMTTPEPKGGWKKGVPVVIRITGEPMARPAAKPSATSRPASRP